MIVTSLPIWLIDVVGSVLMIVLSFMCLLLANRLRNRDRNNVIWTYLLLVCFGLAGFAISRSAGHIVKQLLLISGQAPVWAKIQPFSGAINTISFVFVGSVTLFFERVWRIYNQIEKDKHELQDARDKLIYLNQNLESLVTDGFSPAGFSGSRANYQARFYEKGVLVEAQDSLTAWNIGLERVALLPGKGTPRGFTLFYRVEFTFSGLFPVLLWKQKRWFSLDSDIK